VCLPLVWVGGLYPLTTISTSNCLSLLHILHSTVWLLHHLCSSVIILILSLLAMLCTTSVTMAHSLLMSVICPTFVIMTVLTDRGAGSIKLFHCLVNFQAPPIVISDVKADPSSQLFYGVSRPDVMNQTWAMKIAGTLPGTVYLAL
jgi:hypothetical protein